MLAEGKGDAPAEGTRIAAHYTGTLTDGKKFDSSRDRNEYIRFPVGKGFVIPGWDEALSQMKKGERRILIIPHKLGYGVRRAVAVLSLRLLAYFDGTRLIRTLKLPNGCVATWAGTPFFVFTLSAVPGSQAARLMIARAALGSRQTLDNVPTGVPSCSTGSPAAAALQCQAAEDLVYFAVGAIRR